MCSILFASLSLICQDMLFIIFPGVYHLKSPLVELINKGLQQWKTSNLTSQSDLKTKSVLIIVWNTLLNYHQLDPLFPYIHKCIQKMLNSHCNAS